MDSMSINRHTSCVKPDSTHKSWVSLRIKDKIVETFLRTSKALTSKPETKSLVNFKHGKLIRQLGGLMRQIEFKNQKGALHWVEASIWPTQLLLAKVSETILSQH